jgi:L-ascorbate metabolism protein UlaG (beta-lactamase superfamily)
MIFCRVLRPAGVVMLAASSFLPPAIAGQSEATPAPPPLPKKVQAKAPPTQPFGAKAFEPSDKTVIRWLGHAGFFINSRGTTMMLDPLVEGFDMHIMIEQPIMPRDVPHLDAVLITHADNDHYSVLTARDLKPVTREYHSTKYVSSLMQKDGLPSFGHDVGDVFKVGAVTIKITPVDHDWQNSFPQMAQPGGHHFEKRDACGFWIETPDGNIWAIGDTRLMPEHLHEPTPDAIFFDFSDSPFHLGLDGALKLANTYPNTPLLLSHWGSVEPDMKEFDGNPKDLNGRVVNPERIKILAPGEPFVLNRVKKP